MVIVRHRGNGLSVSRHHLQSSNELISLRKRLEWNIYMTIAALRWSFSLFDSVCGVESETGSWLSLGKHTILMRMRTSIISLLSIKRSTVHLVNLFRFKCPMQVLKNLRPLKTSLKSIRSRHFRSPFTRHCICPWARTGKIHVHSGLLHVVAQGAKGQLIEFPPCFVRTWIH